MRPCLCQPPSGGCVLKRCYGRRPEIRYDPAAFGRLCVETSWLTMLQPLALPAAFGRLCVETSIPAITANSTIQPPSGGCVLKPARKHLLRQFRVPAAFGRLCVETIATLSLNIISNPAAFGRLCVETARFRVCRVARGPAAVGRLCVVT